MKYIKWLLAVGMMLMVTACVNEPDETMIDDETLVEETAETSMGGAGTEAGREDSAQESGEPVEHKDQTTKDNEVIEDIEDDEARAEPDGAESEEVAGTEEASDEPLTPDYEALAVNEVGHIMVVMYHGIKDNPPYHITKENFLKDLNYMYDNGYRLISMSDYLDQTIDIPAGTTPIVFTFDDGLPSTFSMSEVDGELVVNPDSAIGILEAFAEEHPDFGTAASLYIHDTTLNFRGDGTVAERLGWLLDNGYELGNHSATHANFGKLDRIGLIKELGQVEEFLVEQGFSYEMRAVTYPFGRKPDESIIDVISGADYEDMVFGYDVGFREGPSGILYPPSDIRFDPFNAPRVRGSSGAVQDMWWFLEHYDQKNPHLKYVSDGDPATIAVPEALAEKVDMDRYQDHQLITY